MQLKRYSIEELQKLCTDIFYDYMSNDCNSYGITNADVLHTEYEETKKKYENRLEIYYKALRGSIEPDVRNSLETQVQYLKEGLSYISNSNMENQKELYKETQSTDYCRTTIRIPLDKKINSYYDDFTLEVVFYDDVTTLNGLYDDYKKLKTKKDRQKFIQDNTEITHMGLLFTKGTKLVSIIYLMGKANSDNPRVIESGTILLPQKFADFENLSLKDTSEINNNNDLKQFIQSKIDLDKENMKELSSIIIRGDKYGIYQSYANDLYIRYTCRGTGRVYYNALNLNNLKLSSYFEEGNYDTYSKAWWDLNTLGGDPENEKPVIRC